MHMAQAGCGVCKCGPGQVGYVGCRAMTAPQHRKHHPPTAPHGVGQQHIVLGVVQVFFVEQHVHADGAGLLCRYARDQLCV